MYPHLLICQVVLSFWRNDILLREFAGQGRAETTIEKISDRTMEKAVEETEKSACI